MKNIFKGRRFKHGSLATAITVIVIAVIVVVNVVASLLLERFPLTIDLTKDRRFQLTQESVDYLEGLTDDITITVCADETVFMTQGEAYKQAYEIIKNYSKHNAKINVKFVDTTKEPTFSQKYPQYKLTVGDIIVETDLRSKMVDLNDVIVVTTTQYGNQVYSSEAEQSMTSAIMYVTDKNPTKAMVVGGIDNADVSGYTALLERNNYEIISKNIVTDELDADADLLVMGAPAADLSTEQVKKLESYLDNSGQFNKNMVFVASKDYPVQPVLASFLADWGMEIDSGLLVEADSANAINDSLTMINTVVSEEVNSQLKTTELPLIGTLMNPIEALFETDGNRTVETIATTSPTTFVMPLDADENFDPNAQERSTHNVIVKCMRTKYIENTKHVSTVTSIAADTMVYESILQNAGCNNGDIFMTMTNLITEKEDAVTMLPVVFQNESITITQSQVMGIMIAFVFVIPIGILVVGTIIFMRRRHL